MINRKNLSRSEMRRIVVTEFDGRPTVWERVPKLADLLTRVAKALPRDARAAEWADMLDIAELLRPAGKTPDKDVAAMSKLFRDDPAAALSIVGDLLLMQTGLLAAETALTTFLGPAL